MARERDRADPDSTSVRCPSCGWTGARSDMIAKEVDLEVTDYLRTALQTILSSPVQHKYEYSCPSCGRLLATELKFFQPYFDQERDV